MVRMRASVALVALLSAPLACLQGCDSDPVEPVHEVLPVGCPGGWQPVSPPMASALTSGVAYREGNLYVSVGQELISVQVSDGAQAVLSPARADAIWVEGDQLLLLGGTYGTQLFSLPVTGGTPTLIADGTAGRTELGIGQLGSHLPTAIDFFFAESSRVSFTDPTTVWRAPRTGGPPTELARFTELDAADDSALVFEGVALAPEGLVLGASWGVGKVVPLDGGSPQTLAVPEVDNVLGDIDFVGVDARGVYWAVKDRDVHPAVGDQLVISPADGGAVRPVWSQIPAYSYLSHAWPDGAGGLVLVGGQFFRGETFGRTTVWSLDANGAARRLACSPEDTFITDRLPAIAPDAFYFVALMGSPMGSQKQLVRVLRAAP